MARPRAARNVTSNEEVFPAARAVLSLDPELFRSKLGQWYREHARMLPWRGVRNPYAIWLSEIMLQQTRVATVVDRYIAFMGRFPTLQALAEANETDVLALWSGLGYYRRARMLHRAAQFVVRELEGKLPRTAHALRSLPGVGEYTAAAIGSIAFGESIAVVDGNVERVLLRVLGMAEDNTAATRSMIRRTAQSLVPPEPTIRTRTNPPGSHNQAMMELGATVCLPRQPLCLQCPVFDFCRTRGEHATPKREPQKSRVVAHLLALRKAGTVTEVLLERRPEEASLMPRMLELPPLPLDAVEGREPVLRLRHAITNTNFYVQIYAQGIVGGDALPEPGDNDMFVPASGSMEEDVLFAVEPNEQNASNPLLEAVPAEAVDLRWMSTMRLQELPLTGLARKVLQRLGVMRLPRVQMR